MKRIFPSFIFLAVVDSQLLFPTNIPQKVNAWPGMPRFQVSSSLASGFQLHPSQQHHQQSWQIQEPLQQLVQSEKSYKSKPSEQSLQSERSRKSEQSDQSLQSSKSQKSKQSGQSQQSEQPLKIEQSQKKEKQTKPLLQKLEEDSEKGSGPSQSIKSEGTASSNDSDESENSKELTWQDWLAAVVDIGSDYAMENNGLGKLVYHP